MARSKPLRLSVAGGEGRAAFRETSANRLDGLVESQCARVLGDWRAWALWRRSCFRDLTDRRANCFGEGCVWSESKCMCVGSGPRPLEYCGYLPSVERRGLDAIFYFASAAVRLLLLPLDHLMLWGAESTTRIEPMTLEWPGSVKLNAARL